MTDPRAALDELAALSAGAGGPRLHHEPTWAFPYHLALLSANTTDGQRCWSASAFGRTPEEAAERLQAELTSPPEGQWVEARQYEPREPGTWPARWVYPPSRPVAWDGEHWTYADEGDDRRDQ
ncbi:hypothetical protein [Parafrankia sp. FMc2]|uniref:hypothetical protein n=1 Tax=Parafrankia sp. FMc2 TaxID=3233196 RepID=UPI0034D6D0AB